MGKFFTAVKRGFQAMGEAPAALTCTSCGRIEWYLTDPEEVG